MEYFFCISYPLLKYNLIPLFPYTLTIVTHISFHTKHQVLLTAHMNLVEVLKELSWWFHILYWDLFLKKLYTILKFVPPLNIIYNDITII